MTEIVLIGAMGLNREIGINGKLPWDIPEDLVFFKGMTLSNAIVMGRSTYESIGRALPDRRNIVLTSKEIDNPNIEVIHSIEDIKTLNIGKMQDIFIIGGAGVYKQCLHLCDTLMITEVQSTFEADTFMPEFPDEFVLFRETEISISAKSSIPFKFKIYKRKK